jgi:hypothetical protein
VDVSATLDAPCSPAALWAWVEDLSRYPEWLTIVDRAERESEESWIVDLRGRIGPLARSKRLRMVRSTCEEEQRVVFERREADGREHSPWILRAELGAVDGGTHLSMHLHYGGGLWGPVIEHLLRDEIGEGRDRLRALVSGGAA